MISLRKVLRSLFWLSPLGWLSFAVTAAVPMNLPVPELEKLPNGLTVAWFLRDTLPVIDVALLVQSGSRDDAPGKAGTSELLAAVMDRGVAGMSAREFALQVERLGASRYITSGEDAFTLGMHGLAPDGLRLLELLSKVALTPTLAEAEVARERERTLASWQNLGDQPAALATLLFHRIITGGTDYARGNLVNLKEVAAITRDDLKNFHAQHFTPANSVLMIVGRADRATMRAKIGALFGPWSGGVPTDKRTPFTFPGLRAAKGEVFLVNRPGVNQAQVRMGLRISDVHSGDRYALAVTNALLGEYFDSRLNSVIRDQLGLTYGIGSSVVYTQDQGRFLIGGATRATETGRFIVETLKILANLVKTPIPAEEVETAREYLVGGFPLSVATLGAVAARWLAGYVYALGPNYLNEFIPKISAITPEEASAAAHKELRLADMVTVVAGDEKQIEPSLRKQGFKVRKITLQQLLGEKAK